MNSLKLFLIIFGILLFPNLFSQNGKILNTDGIKKLSVFIGKWKSQNDTSYHNNTSAEFSCKWSANGNYLVCDQLVSRGTIKTNNLAIYSYDSLNKYKLAIVGIANMEPFTLPIISNKDTLIYLGSYTENGVKIYTRTLNIFESSSKYRFISQSSKDRILWNTSLEGTSVKIAD